MQLGASSVNRGDGRVVDLGEGRSDTHNSQRKQRLFRRYRDLLIDEVRDAGRFCTRNERLSYGVERLCLGRGQGPQRCSLRTGLAWREQQFRAVHRKGKYAEPDALYEGAPIRVAHCNVHPSAPAISVPILSGRARVNVADILTPNTKLGAAKP